MKETKSIKWVLIVALVTILAAVLAVAPSQIRAADQDKDGFLDSTEGSNFEDQCAGFSTILDPARPDAFIILEEAADGWFQLFGVEGLWYTLLQQTQSDGGLDFVVHELQNPNCPDRLIQCHDSQGSTCLAGQLGAALVEDTFNNVGQMLGWCPQGTFNTEEDCPIWPLRIRSQIIVVCGDRHPGENCKDTEGNTGVDLELRYLTWVMVHELGHKLTTARCYDALNNGNHHYAGYGCIMDMAPTAKDKRGTVTFTFPDKFCSQCQEAVDLAVDDSLDIAACEVVEDVKAGGKKTK